MTKLLEEKELAEIRERDAGPSHGTCWEAHTDRRALLSHVDALKACYDGILDAGNKALVERDSLSQRLAASERDAARYRWLRDQAHPDSESTGLSCMEQRYNDWGKSYHHHFVGAELDAAVDAALSSQEQKCETCYGSKRIPDNNGYGLESLPCPTCCSPSATEK